MAVCAKVRLEYLIELDVAAESEDDVYDWMMANTPQGVLDDMNKRGKNIYEGYDEHIIEWYKEDEPVCFDIFINGGDE